MRLIIFCPHMLENTNTLYDVCFILPLRLSFDFYLLFFMNKILLKEKFHLN